MDRGQLARVAASTYLTVSPDALKVWDVTEGSFSWAKTYAFYSCDNHRLIDGFLVPQESVLVAVHESGKTLLFEPLIVPFASTRADRNQNQLNQIFLDEGIAFPPPNVVAFPRTARAMLTGLRLGWLASPGFWESVKGRIDVWTSSPRWVDSPDGPHVFEMQCREPVMVRNEDGSWKCEFRYFNTGGGVEAWRLEGDARELQRAEAEMAFPNGTWVVLYG
jgi:hypothetical protein